MAKIYEISVTQHTRKDEETSLVGAFFTKDEATKCFEKNANWAKDMFKEEKTQTDIGEDYFSISVEESENYIEVTISEIEVEEKFDETKHLPPFSLWWRGQRK